VEDYFINMKTANMSKKTNVKNNWNYYYLPRY